MTDIMTIPLNRLTPWKGNVRKTGASEGIEELAASIAAHGQLQSLVVRDGTRGKYEILAGRRRYLALQYLAKTGRIGKDHPVQCTLAQADANATELSLVENTVRVPMHPADQFEAFRELIDAGAGVADVAARFGIADSLVTRRLKLGRLSPSILDAYRKDEIDLEQAQAFAISDDHAAQERVLASSPQWGLSAHAIRRALTQDEVPTSDKRVQFSGLDAYRAAGGLVRQDLFSDEDSGYIADLDLLERLVSEKLSRAAEAVQAEGWKWVEALVDRDSDMLSTFVRQQPHRVELSQADQAEHERLTHEYDDLMDSDDDVDDEKIEAVQEALDTLSARMEVWLPETLTVCGAVLSIGHNGDLRIERGLLAKTEAKKLKAKATVLDASEPMAPALPARLIADLTAQRSAALAVELGRRPDVALAAVVHAMLLERFPSYEQSCLGVSIRTPGLVLSVRDAEACRPLAELDIAREALRISIPQDEQALWPYCMSRTRDELLAMLAVLVASTVDAVCLSSDWKSNNTTRHADLLAAAVTLDMTVWFTPTAESYFSRINRSQILAALDEANGSHAPSLEKLKKDELAVRAEGLVAGTGWLPEPLRVAANDNGDVELSDAAE